MRPNLALLLAPFLFAMACAGTDDANFGDPRDASFLSATSAKADELGIPTQEAQTILYHVNTLSLEALDADVALDARAARNIVAARDVAPISTLEQLDAIPYVGPTAFDRLRVWAAAHPIELAACGNAIVEADEQCDDANSLNYDGCSATCEVESAKVHSGFTMPNIGGFRRFQGSVGFQRGGSSGSISYGIEALTPIMLQVDVHDGAGQTPMASFQDRWGTTGKAPAEMRFLVDEIAAGTVTRRLDTTDTGFTLALPAGTYVLRQLPRDNASSRFDAYAFTYQMDLTVTGDVASCVRRNCEAETYVLNQWEGEHGYLVNFTDHTTRPATGGSLQPPQWPVDNTVNTARLNAWPVDIGNTRRFQGDMGYNRVKYFWVRIEEPTALKVWGVKGLDWSGGLGGAYLTNATGRLYRHDFTRRGPGYAMARPSDGVYRLEPGDYMFEVAAGTSWLGSRAVRTTFEVNFSKTPN